MTPVSKQIIDHIFAGNADEAIRLLDQNVNQEKVRALPELFNLFKMMIYEVALQKNVSGVTIKQMSEEIERLLDESH